MHYNSKKKLEKKRGTSNDNMVWLHGKSKWTCLKWRRLIVPLYLQSNKRWRDVEQLLENPNLSPFQKITLQDALTDGTHTREHVLQANRKSKPKDILKLFREGNYG